MSSEVLTSLIDIDSFQEADVVGISRACTDGLAIGLGDGERGAEAERAAMMAKASAVRFS